MPETRRSVAASAASLLGSRFAVALIALLFLGVTARLLSIEEMAAFAVYNSLCGLVTVVSSLGLLAAGLKRLPAMIAAGEAGAARRSIRISLGVYVVAGLLWTVALVSLSEPLGRILLKSDGRGGHIALAAVAALCFGLYEASQLVLSGLQRYERLSRNNVLTAGIQRVLSLGLLLVLGFPGFLIGFAIGSLVGAGYGLIGITPSSAAATSPGLAEIREDVKYALPFYVDGYFRYFYMHADQLIVGVFLSPVALSIYFIAKRFLQYCQMLVSSLVDPLGTRVAERDTEDRKATVRIHDGSLRWFVILFLPLSALLACMSPFLMRAVAGNRYAEGAPALALLFLSVFFFAMFSHRAVFVFVLGAPSERLRTNLVSTAAQAAGLLLLMPAFGLPGLAIARSAGFAIAERFARARLSRIRPGLISAVGRHALSSGIPWTALMVTMILLPYAYLEDPVWLPLLAIPATGACLLGFRRWVLSPREREEAASLLHGQGRVRRFVRTLIAP